MLEFWNFGILGFGEVGKCNNGKKHFDTEAKDAFKFKLPLKSNIPIFHRSIIPVRDKK